MLQFTFSFCMIICAILVYSQIQYVRNKPLGFSKDNLIQIEKAGEFTNPVKTELFRQELLKAGVITAATEYYAGLTNGGDNSADITWPGHDQHWLYSWNNRVAGYDFTQTLGLKILEGRDFSRNFSSDTSSVLLNEAAVKSMELQKPLGKQFKKSGKLFTIIGVLQDYNYESASYRTAPTITYLSNHTHEADRTILLRLNPKHNLSSAIQTINEWNRRLNPAYPSELIFIDQEMEDKLANEKLLSSLSNLFGGFAIFISCLGLLGLALYIAEQRSKEISIRKVLGADLSNILFLLNKDFLILVVLSNLIACPLAYIISYQWLQKFDYSIELTIWPMLTTTGLSLLIAIFTVGIQSFKIAKANPIDALKYE
ncbi:ABC-type antimicrobial peptide transport system permease subunit [Pedobacter cryoconitis]|nr:ABC-type antimicrobial peptide transport system permease subunit [Pedobacter cryoconitis]